MIKYKFNHSKKGREDLTQVTLNGNTLYILSGLYTKDVYTKVCYC